MKTGLDHLILGINDLDRGIDWVEQKTGVRPIFGGVHPGRGTRNALLSLGANCYLEIMAPDPQQSLPTWFSQIVALTEPRLLTWAVHTSDLAGLAEFAGEAGIPIDGPHDGARTRPDGKVLRWKLFHLQDNRGGLLPFIIEWSSESMHPASDAPEGCSLLDFQVHSPDDRDLSRTCEVFAVEVAIKPAGKPGLRAAISSPKGEVVLTS